MMHPLALQKHVANTKTLISSHGVLVRSKSVCRQGMRWVASRDVVSGVAIHSVDASSCGESG